jgi:uncharacterized protein YprB with RNaseH-like and TPR domain
MLEHTFCHAAGISDKTEQKLWNAGILSWQDVLQQERRVLGAKRWEVLEKTCRTSQRCLDNRQPYYFQSVLPPKEHWRLFADFREQVAYLDIETNGGDRSTGLITTIALYDGREIHHYVYGYNLPQFRHDIHRYKMLVTFNGKAFDIPFLEARLKMRIPHVHIDLCHVMRALGYKGGLKKVEKAFGMDRGDLDGVDGRLAIWLWQDFQRNRNFKAMDTLLAYNIADTLNLETLMVHAWNLQMAELSFGERYKLPLPTLPPLPFEADVPTVKRLLNRYRAW